MLHDTDKWNLGGNDSDLDTETQCTNFEHRMKCVYVQAQWLQSHVDKSQAQS